MAKNYSVNYYLFNKYLSKISADTIAKFGTRENVLLFLQTLCETGNIALSSRSVIVASIIQLHQLIHNDKALTKCVAIAISCASEKAESILYDRAINGYEELTYDSEGKIIVKKKKYCSKSLLEYLKANSIKYGKLDKSLKNSAKNNDKQQTHALAKTANFVVKSYEEASNNQLGHLAEMDEANDA